jgi:hypothetical protein
MGQQFDQFNSLSSLHQFKEQFGFVPENPKFAAMERLKKKLEKRKNNKK